MRHTFRSVPHDARGRGLAQFERLTLGGADRHARRPRRGWETRHAFRSVPNDTRGGGRVQPDGLTCAREGLQ